jgi:hypothetical protein
VSALCVHGESGGLRKRHAALVALVRSYARVRARVNTKSAAYGKRFIAFITFVPEEYSHDQLGGGEGNYAEFEVAKRVAPTRTSRGHALCATAVCLCASECES